MRSSGSLLTGSISRFAKLAAVPRLAKWIATIRESCAERSRADIADICIGKLLWCAPVGKDSVWPREPVRDVMEEIRSEPMMQGAHTGVYDSRGVHWRGEGGDQERELAEKYRKCGQALQVSHPFVASKLLMWLAKTYEHEARRDGTEAGIRRRLRYSRPSKWDLNQAAGASEQNQRVNVSRSSGRSPQVQRKFGWERTKKGHPGLPRSAGDRKNRAASGPFGGSEAAENIGKHEIGCGGRI